MKSYNNITSSGSKIHHESGKSSIQTVVSLYICTGAHPNFYGNDRYSFGSQEKESPDNGVILCAGFGWVRVNSLHFGWY